MKKFIFIAVLLLSLSRLSAQFDVNGGVWLPQIYVQDTIQGIEEIAKLTEQLQTMRQQVKEAQELVRLADEMYYIAQDPSGIVDSMSTFRGATRQLDQAFGLPGAAEMHDLSVEMERSSTAVDRFGNTVDGFGNNDRSRNHSLSSSHQVLKRFYNRYEDMTSFTQEQNAAITEEVDSTISDLASLDPSDDQAQNRARAMENKIAALQRERLLLYQQQQMEYYNARMAEMEYDKLEEELVVEAILQERQRAGDARTDYVERIEGNKSLMDDFLNEPIPERDPIVIK